MQAGGFVAPCPWYWPTSGTRGFFWCVGLSSALLQLPVATLALDLWDVRERAREQRCMLSQILHYQAAQKLVRIRTQCPLKRICRSEPSMLLHRIPPLCTIIESPDLTLQGSPSTSSKHGGWVNPHFHRILILQTNSLGRKMQCNWNHFDFPSPALRDLFIIKIPLTVPAECYLIGFYYYAIPGSKYTFAFTCPRWGCF